MYFKVIDDSSRASELKIVDSFVDFILHVDQQRVLPEEVEDALLHLEHLIWSEEEELGDIETSPYLTQLKQAESYLKKYSELNVFGYNSSRYDLTILMGYIIESLERRQIVTDLRSGLQILKKGSAYFTLKFGNIIFKDLMNFTCPMNLDKYMKTWLGHSQKQVNLNLKIVTKLFFVRNRLILISRV